MKKMIEMYVAMQSKMQSMVKDEKGATMVEYALMVALIAVVAMAGVTLIGTGTLGTFTNVAGSIAPAP